jgi:hypothetical protein
MNSKIDLSKESSYTDCMKISELIKALEDTQKLHGDIDVEYDCGWGGYHIVDVTEVKVNTSDKAVTVQIG